MIHLMRYIEYSFPYSRPSVENGKNQFEEDLKDQQRRATSPPVSHLGLDVSRMAQHDDFVPYPVTRLSQSARGRQEPA